MNIIVWFVLITEQYVITNWLHLIFIGTITSIAQLMAVIALCILHSTA